MHSILFRKGHKQSTCLNKNDFLNKFNQFKLTTEQRFKWDNIFIIEYLSF